LEKPNTNIGKIRIEKCVSFPWEFIRKKLLLQLCENKARALGMESMQKTKIILFGFICLLASILCINAAFAATATYASVWTTDTSNVNKIKFDPGETVRIHWKADGTVNIDVWKIGGDREFLISDQPEEGYYDFVPSQGNGFYQIWVTGASAGVTIAYGTFFVIPELPLGVLMAVVGCFAAFGALKFRRKRIV